LNTVISVKPTKRVFLGDDFIFKTNKLGGKRLRYLPHCCFVDFLSATATFGGVGCSCLVLAGWAASKSNDGVGAGGGVGVAAITGFY
jgi:hypothetical protein